MSTDFAAARLNMVESQIRTADVTDLPLQDALRVVPRESVVPASKAYQAYADADIEYAPGRWLLRPREVGKLLQVLKPRGGEKALAIAAPYAAAVMEAMGLSVTRLEGDDLKAVPTGAYDVIVCEGAVAVTPKAWQDALAVGGRLGVVERTGPVGRGTIYLRAEDGLGRRQVFDASPPILAGFEAEAGFSF